MRESRTGEGIRSAEIERNPVPHGAENCTGNLHVLIARQIWKFKTAEHWAAAAGKRPRIAKYWLSTGKVSAAGKLAIIKLLV
jgi:hypothetical protein